MTENDEPRVTLALPYRWALRLSYMARFPTDETAEDDAISGAVDEAIRRAEHPEGDLR